MVSKNFITSRKNYPIEQTTLHLFRFSKAIGSADSNLAEILAIREAFVLFAESQWACLHKLIVESDSSNAVCWSNYSTNVPWAMRHINQIECLKENIREWEAVHVRRTCNSAADSLAKEAVYREEDPEIEQRCCMFCIPSYKSGLGCLSKDTGAYYSVLLQVVIHLCQYFTDQLDHVWHATAFIDNEFCNWLRTNYIPKKVFSILVG
ncbi:hypothetical protein PTKIN_Ptkin09bG0277700 [Pterospermum kingtungense]